MKMNWNYIKGSLLLGLVFFLFAFAEKRNSNRKLAAVNLHFTNSENLYITEKAVNKLLIQNKVEAQTVDKETLDLNRVETLLDGHQMIENAEVFMSIEGVLGARITQRKPIARILAAAPYYMDRQGKEMPLSEYYSARVPLVTGVSIAHFEEFYPLMEYIRNDLFLSQHITGIKRLISGKYEMQLRELDFVLFFGNATDMERKFNNFKAFYKKAVEDNKLNSYRKVNLQFGDQVVCTKK